MNILITGVNGFIGTALWNYLKAQKFPFEVFGIDIQLKNPARHLSVCDLGNPRQLKKVLNRVQPDVIFHLAGGRPADENALWQANFIPTKILLDAATELKGISPCIIIPGSAAEYGPIKSPQRPVSEEISPEPYAWYGFVKYIQTNFGLMYARKGLDVRIARIFNIGGYGTPASLALGNFSKKIVQIERGQEPLTLKVGDLSGRRDFIDIEDVCSALWAIARKGKRGEIYNVCSGKSSSMRALLCCLVSYSGVKVVIKEEQKAHSTSFDITGSNAKIRRATGWRPHVDLEQSLRNTLQYYRKL